MARNIAIKCALLAVLSAMGGIGCVPIQFRIENIEGAFDPAAVGLTAGEDFTDVEIRVPILSLDLSEMIEQARQDLGIPVNLQALIVNSIEFDANEGSSFDFVDSVELSFLPDGETFDNRMVLTSQNAPASGFGDMVVLDIVDDFDILPFITDSEGDNAGELILIVSGTAPDGTQTWLSTLVVTAIVGLGS